MVLKYKRLGIQDFGYDTFIGREVFDTGLETYYVTLNLRSLGSISYLSLEMACDQLCDEVKKGNKVLLSRSPGQVESKIRKASDVARLLNSVLGEITGEGRRCMIINQPPETECYYIGGKKYKPFKKEQMALLHRMYRDNPEMKQFLNPFDTQTIIN